MAAIWSCADGWTDNRSKSVDAWENTRRIPGGVTLPVQALR
jgi:hypothetical protein